MKIEVGKYYRTRNGWKAYVAVRMPPNPFINGEATWPFLGYVGDDCGSSIERSWTEDGRVYSNQSKSGYDLIAPWVDEPANPWSFQPQDGDYCWVRFPNGDQLHEPVHLGPLLIRDLAAQGCKFAKCEPPPIEDDDPLYTH